MNVAAPKSNAIYITSKRSAARDKATHTFNLSEADIPWVDTVTFLGILIDEKLSWRQQIDKLIADSKKKIHAIRQLARVCREDSAKEVLKIFHSLVTSTFAYAAPAVMGMHASIWNDIEKFFASAIKQIFGLPLGMNGERAISLFSTERLTDKLQRAAIHRIGDIIRGVPIVQDLVLNCRAGYSLNRYRSPLQHCFEVMGYSGDLGCPLCKIIRSHCD